MHILKGSFSVGRRAHAQVFLVFPVPERRNIFHRDLAREERFLDLIADDDVECVGELVRLSADQRRTDRIHRLVKLPFGYICHHLREQLADLGIGEVHESFRPGRL